MQDDRTATAHLTWDARWQSPESRSQWLDPEPEVAALVPELRARGVGRVLDLGCGVGRHALFLAAQGFEVHALDASPAGLAFARTAAAEAGLPLSAVRAAMTALPYADGAFDFVLSWNVIYHGDPGVVCRTLAEIARLLRPGGVYQGTMLTKRNRSFGQGNEIAPDTWVDPAVDDKAHPHFYCDIGGLAELFVDFEMIDLREREHAAPGSWHWHLTAERGA